MRIFLITVICVGFAAIAGTSDAQVSISLPILEDTTLINGSSVIQDQRNELIIGNAGGTSGRSSLLRFDLSSLSIPAGMQVASVSAATLDLTVPQGRVDSGLHVGATIDVSALSVEVGDWLIDEANWTDRFQDDVETNNAGDPLRHRWAAVGGFNRNPSSWSEIGSDGVFGPTEAGPDGEIGTEDDNTADDRTGFDPAGNTYANGPDILGIVGQATIDASGADFSVDLAAAPETGADMATILNNWQQVNSGLHLSAPDALGQVFLGSQQSDQVDAASAVLNLTFTLEDIPTGMLGDFDGDGDVDLADLDQYNGNIGASPTGALAALDLDDDGDIDGDDLAQHYTDLVQTSNGETGTFAGDLNLDGTVNVLGDAFPLVGNLGNAATSWAQGDFNADGQTNVLGDAFALVGNLGKNNASGGSPSAAAVPEPGSISLLMLAAVGMGMRRKR